MGTNSKVYKWSLIERLTVTVLNFGGNIVLARLLTTADFGLLAMIAIFTSIAYDLSSCGLSDGLIHKKSPTADDYSTVFVFNAGVGFIFGTLFFVGAPWVAAFFGHNELIGIMRVLGVCFFCQTMSFVQETRLRKELKMKKVALVRIGATVTSLTLGIFLAANGFGYWALVSTQILLSFFLFIYFVAATRYFPRIRFKVRAFKEFFYFGIHLMLAYLGNIIGKNVNTFVLGKFFSPSTSGVYYQGAKLANVPFAVTETSINSPFFVIASNENDKKRQRFLIHDMLSTIVALNGAILMLMLVIARPGIEALYGQKWIAAVPVFRILALFEFLAGLKYYFHSVCKVHARTVFIRNMSFGEVAIQLALLAIFYRHGLIWIAWTQIGGVAVSVLAHTILFTRLNGMSIGRFIATIIKAMVLPVAGAVVAATVGYGMAAAGGIHPLVESLMIIVTFFGAIIGAGELFRPPLYIAVRSRLFHRQSA